MSALLRVLGVRQRLVLLTVLAIFGLGAISAAAIDTQALVAEVRRGLAAGEPGQIGVICANADISAESALTAEQREVVVTEFTEACGVDAAKLSTCPAWTAFLESYQSQLASLGADNAAIAADVSRWYGAVAALAEPAAGPRGTTGFGGPFFAQTPTVGTGGGGSGSAIIEADGSPSE
ncbi:MAG: hypothetical protein WAS73_07435 [Defluviicoccus sp.]